MTEILQTTIIKNLITNEDYTRKVLPFIKKEYFTDEHKFLFNQVTKFVEKYNALPTQKSLEIDISNENISDEIAQGLSAILPSIFNESNEPLNDTWLIEQTEKWCRDRAIYLAIMNSIEIIDGRDKKHTENAIPEILKDALSVSFDTNIGHDYIDNAKERFEFYHKKEDRIPFDLQMFNEITKGGLPNKTLNIALAGTGVGKSLFMCHCAGSSIQQGKNVLYITMEMAEERIAERIDANLMEIAIDELETIPLDVYSKKIEKIKSKTIGKLIIKEYPTGSAHVGHFRALLSELALKKNYKPDIIFIDYLNICSSSRIKGLGGSINTYSYVKSIAEELRGLAVEANVPIVSATQTTRSGYSSSDVGLEDTSESFGLPATADMLFALITGEDLERRNQIMVKQLKNRYNDPTKNKRFVIGVDRAQMRLYDVEDSAQTLTHEPEVTSNNPYVANNKKTRDFSGFNYE